MRPRKPTAKLDESILRRHRGRGRAILLDEHGRLLQRRFRLLERSVHPSHVLKAMGCSNERARASMRFSFGRFNTDAEIDEAIEIASTVVEKLARSRRLAAAPFFVS